MPPYFTPTVMPCTLSKRQYEIPFGWDELHALVKSQTMDIFYSSVKLCCFLSNWSLLRVSASFISLKLAMLQLVSRSWRLAGSYNSWRQMRHDEECHPVAKECQTRPLEASLNFCIIPRSRNVRH